MRRYRNMKELSHRDLYKARLNSMDKLSLGNNWDMKMISNKTWNTALVNEEFDEFRREFYKHTFKMYDIDRTDYDIRYAIFEDKEDSIADYTIFDILKRKLSFRHEEYEGKNKLVEVDMDRYTIQNGPDRIGDRRGISIPYISK